MKQWMESLRQNRTLVAAGKAALVLMLVPAALVAQMLFADPGPTESGRRSHGYAQEAFGRVAEGMRDVRPSRDGHTPKRKTKRPDRPSEEIAAVDASRYVAQAEWNGDPNEARSGGRLTTRATRTASDRSRRAAPEPSEQPRDRKRGKRPRPPGNLTGESPSQPEPEPPVVEPEPPAADPAPPDDGAGRPGGAPDDVPRNERPGRDEDDD